MKDNKRYLLIRVDLCTMSDFSEGLSNILAIFSDFGIKTTFFAAMGPDNLGRLAFRRLFSKKFIRQVYYINPISTYGLKNLVSGLITEGPILSKVYRDRLESISADGHEVGIHGYDHARWSDYYMRMDKDEIKDEITRAVERYTQILGSPPSGFAAPSWGCTIDTLKAQEEFNFSYTSDTRGKFPFFPKINGHVFKTLQIPVTLPTFFELLSENNNKNLAAENQFCKIMQHDVNVIILHPAQEGKANRQLLINLLDELNKEDIYYITHIELARMILTDKSKIPVCDVKPAQVFGAFREVGSQQ